MQALASLLPGMGLALPAGHGMHASLLLAPMLGLYDPAWHGVKASDALAALSIAQYLRRATRRARHGCPQLCSEALRLGGSSRIDALKE